MNTYNFMNKKITFLSVLAFLLLNINTNAQDLRFSMLSTNSFEKSIKDILKKYRVSNKDIMKYFEKEVLTIG